MESIKKLFNSTTYGEIIEDIGNQMQVDEYQPSSDTEYTDRLRKRKIEPEQSMDIDLILLLETPGIPHKKHKIVEELSTLNGIEFLSPKSIDLVWAESVSNRQALVNDIIRDNDKIDAIMSEIESQDDDFTFSISSEVGNYMELWICANLKCPGCRVGKLFKYISSNMPVIDVRCVNPAHDLLEHGPIFYQIKTTEKYTTFLGLKYFTRQPINNYPSGYIKVGSKKVGIYSHSITTADSIENKFISIGYICVTFKYLTNRRRINIDLNDSFVVIPNLNYYSRTRKNSYYYKYIPNSLNYSIISFNPNINIVRVLTFSELALRDGYVPTIFKNINLDKKYKTIPLTVPTSAYRELIFKDDDDYESKYLYYKNKYLKLKYNL